MKYWVTLTRLGVVMSHDDLPRCLSMSYGIRGESLFEARARRPGNKLQEKKR